MTAKVNLKDVPFDTQIIHDHREVAKLYEKYKLTPKIDLDVRQRIVNSIIREIAMHSVSEEVNIYPLFERILTAGKELADGNRKEHQSVKNNLYKVDGMNIDDEKFDETLALVMKDFF
ncbi:hypothetical protein HK102_002475, partial [Quaeritorhiza haematococci]